MNPLNRKWKRPARGWLRMGITKISPSPETKTQVEKPCARSNEQAAGEVNKETK